MTKCIMCGSEPVDGYCSNGHPKQAVWSKKKRVIVTATMIPMVLLAIPLCMGVSVIGSIKRKLKGE